MTTPLSLARRPGRSRTSYLESFNDYSAAFAFNAILRILSNQPTRRTHRPEPVQKIESRELNTQMQERPLRAKNSLRRNFRFKNRRKLRRISCVRSGREERCKIARKEKRKEIGKKPNRRRERGDGPLGRARSRTRFCLESSPRYGAEDMLNRSVLSADPPEWFHPRTICWRIKTRLRNRGQNEI